MANESIKPLTQRLNGWLFRNHRWFGVVSCVAVMMWGLSGVMHPIMSRLNPVAANPMPPQTAPALHGAQSPAAVLQRAGIHQIDSLRVLVNNDSSYYQVSIPGQAARRYFEVNSGEEWVNGDAQFAESLARHFIADTSSQTQAVTRLDKFDDEYLSINRLLPVYRVNLARDDHLRVYVETSPPRLSALVDDRKELLGDIFRLLHNWDFLDAWDNTRKSLICILLGLALFSALSGIWMYGFLYKRGNLSRGHTPLRRWHRTVGIVVSASALLFVVSAAWHLLGSERRSLPALLASPINTASLGELPDSVRHGSWGKITLLAVNGEAYYQLLPPSFLPTSRGKARMGVEAENNSVPSSISTSSPISTPSITLPLQGGGDEPHAEHDHSAQKKTADGKKMGAVYVRASDGEVLPEASRSHAISLAGQYSRLPNEQITDVTLVTKFEGEYGFFNKRLPVWRVDYNTPEHLSYYVETSSGALAAVVNDAARTEGWVFSYLHKFHWLDFAGKDVRDFIMGLFGLGNLIVAVLGLWMFTRRYTKRPNKQRESRTA